MNIEGLQRNILFVSAISTLKCRGQPNVYADALKALFKAQRLVYAKHPVLRPKQVFTKSKNIPVEEPETIIDLTKRIAEIRKAAREATLQGLQKLEDKFSSLVQNQDAIDTLQTEVKSLHERRIYIQERHKVLDAIEDSTVKRVGAIAIASLGLGVGITVIPAHPFIGSLLIAGISPLRYALNASDGDDPNDPNNRNAFQWSEFWRRYATSALTNAISYGSNIGLLMIPHGRHFTARIIAQGVVSAIGRTIELLSYDQKLTKEDLFIACAAGCTGALASLGMEKLAKVAIPAVLKTAEVALSRFGYQDFADSYFPDIVEVIEASLSGAISASVTRIVNNSGECIQGEDTHLLKGVEEAMILSALTSAAIKISHLRQYHSNLSKYNEKKEQLDELIKEKEKELKERRSGPDLEQLDELIKKAEKALKEGRGSADLDAEIAKLKNEIAALQSSIMQSNNTFDEAIQELKRQIKNYYCRGYHPVDMHKGKTSDEIVACILKGEIVKLKHHSHRCYFMKRTGYFYKRYTTHDRKIIDDRIEWVNVEAMHQSLAKKENLQSLHNLRLLRQQQERDLGDLKQQKCYLEHLRQHERDLGDWKQQRDVSVPPEQEAMYYPYIIQGRQVNPLPLPTLSPPAPALTQTKEQVAPDLRPGVSASLANKQALLPKHTHSLPPPPRVESPPPLPLQSVRPRPPLIPDSSQNLSYSAPAILQPMEQLAPDLRPGISASLANLRLDVERDRRGLERAYIQYNELTNTSAKQQAKKAYLTNLIHELNISIKKAEKDITLLEKRLAALRG